MELTRLTVTMLPIQASLGHAISRASAPNDEINFAVKHM